MGRHMFPSSTPSRGLTQLAHSRLNSPKQHLDPFSRFCTAHPCELTDRDKVADTHRMCRVASSSIAFAALCVGDAVQKAFPYHNCVRCRSNVDHRNYSQLSSTDDGRLQFITVSVHLTCNSRPKQWSTSSRGEMIEAQSLEQRSILTLWVFWDTSYGKSDCWNSDMYP